MKMNIDGVIPANQVKMTYGEKQMKFENESDAIQFVVKMESKMDPERLKMLQSGLTTPRKQWAELGQSIPEIIKDNPAWDECMPFKNGVWLDQEPVKVKNGNIFGQFGNLTTEQVNSFSEAYQKAYCSGVPTVLDQVTIGNKSRGLEHKTIYNRDYDIVDKIGDLGYKRLVEEARKTEPLPITGSTNGAIVPNHGVPSYKPQTYTPSCNPYYSEIKMTPGSILVVTLPDTASESQRVATAGVCRTWWSDHMKKNPELESCSLWFAIGDVKFTVIKPEEEASE